MLGLFILFATALALISLIGSVALLITIHRPRRKTFAVALALGCPTEPEDLGLVGEEATFNLPGPGQGYTSPGWIIRGDKPGGPSVVVLHGHRDSRYGALYRAKMLAPYAGRVVVFDWPGHGDCTAPWMVFGEREVQDVLAVLDGLPDQTPTPTLNGEAAKRLIPAPQPPQGRAVLFGYSLGAQIAIKTAALHPDRFAGVIADGPYRRWDSPIRVRMKRMRLPAFLFIWPIAVYYLLRGYLPGFDRLAFAQKLQCPLLVIHGTHDPVCPFEEGKELADAAPHGTFVPIDGGGHINLDGHDAETYQAALAAFFAGLDAGEA